MLPRITRLLRVLASWYAFRRSFSQLRELVLDNNLLGDEFDLPPLPLLRTLSLNKNLISNLDRLLVRCA